MLCCFPVLQGQAGAAGGITRDAAGLQPDQQPPMQRQHQQALALQQQQQQRWARRPL